MPVPFERGHDDQQIVRYLLELLPDAERDRLDEVTIVDDEMAARVRVVEDDLVDAYVSGTLTGETRERFESHYLRSPRRRERVQFAGTFLRTVDRLAASGRAGRGLQSAPTSSDVELDEGSRAEKTLRLGPRRGAALWLTPMSRLAAVAALAVLACGLLLVQTWRLRSGLTVAQSQSAASDRRARELEQQLSDQRTANAAMTNELERMRQSAATSPQAAERSDAPVSGPTTALVLLPQTRSVGALPTLAIGPRDERVSLALQLESQDFPTYQAALTDPATGEVVWRSAGIAATSRDGTPTLTLVLSARVLKAQHYSVAVSGQRAGGAEVVGSYAFQVVRP